MEKQKNSEFKALLSGNILKFEKIFFVGVVLAILLGIILGFFVINKVGYDYSIHAAINVSAGLVIGLILGALLFKKKQQFQMDFYCCFLVVTLMISYTAIVSNVIGAVSAIFFELLFLSFLIASIFLGKYAVKAIA